MWHVYYTKQALKDIEKLKAAGLDAKAKDLIRIIKKDPLQNPPKVEKLVGNLASAYSRRINIQHRLVYEILVNKNGELDSDGNPWDGNIKILRMWSHYK